MKGELFRCHFKEYLRLLIRRRNRFLAIWTGNGIHPCGPQIGSNEYFDALTYFDMLIVQLRAICIEKRKTNYTIQAFLNAVNDKYALDVVDEMLEQAIPVGDPENPEMMPLKKSIRLLSDKVICHYDSFCECPDFASREREECLERALLPFGDRGQIWWLGQLVDLIYNVTKRSV